MTRTVKAVWVNHDTDLMDVTIIGPSGQSSVIHATAHHLFWDVTAGSWVEADALYQGDRLRADDGSWWIPDASLMRSIREGLRKRYPERAVVPFARRNDNDDIACWDTSDLTVIVIHDFAAPGSEGRQTFENFTEWFRSAIEDMLEF